MSDRTTDTGEREEAKRFEKILSDVKTRFITASYAEMDTAIEDAQRAFCELFGLDRSAIWQWSLEEPGIINLTHISQPADGPPVGKTSDASLLSNSAWVLRATDLPTIYMRSEGKAFFPWISRQMRQGVPLVITRLEDLPEAAAYDREMLRQYGTKSTTLLPLYEGEAWLGILTFASLLQEHEVSPARMERYTQVAHILSTTLTRQRTELRLRLAEARLALAAESGDADLWNMVISTGRLWVPDVVRKKYGIAPDGVFTLEMFLDFVHPDDREKIHAAVRDTVDTGHLADLEYRVTYADGTRHWVTSRGRLHRNAAGEPYSLMGLTIDITERKRLEEQLQKQYLEIEGLKQRLEQENIYLQKEIKSQFPHSRIIGQSVAMKNAMTQAMQVAETNTTVLILGESGTGKELLARAIHEQSRRSSRPMITVNCASFPPSLIESELFGREKGAYTGAFSRVIGRFELADESTIFLDEIGELPFDLQAKLLRVIEEGILERLGSPQTIKVNLRIIAATNRDLQEEVRAGRFRLDLYYRLNVFPILIPPLRERQEDIPPLVWALVRELQESLGKKIARISEKTMKRLTSYHWPGNIRELRNVIERAMILSPGPALDVILPEPEVQNQGSSEALHDIDREHILAVLANTGWRVSKAAAVLGLKRTTLYTKMTKLGIKPAET